MTMRYAQQNPFRDCADPGSAIPSSACDRALAALEQAIVAQRNPIVLVGPIGAGKTLLLRRIVEKPPLFTRTIFLPWLNAPADEVIPWIRAFEGSEASEDDFVTTARELRAGGVQTLLIIDEAESMPRESAARLAELVNGAGNAVQVLLAGTNADSLQAAVATFHGAAQYVELEGEVTPLEVATWAHNTFDADELSHLRQLDWAELVQKAQGIPRLVRWELERRLATRDLGAVLGVEAPEALEGRMEPVQTVGSFEAGPLPAACAPTEDSGTGGSAFQIRLDPARGEVGTLLDRLTDRIRHIASRSGVASREAIRAGRHYADVLGQGLGQTANKIHEASRTESGTVGVTDEASDVSARGSPELDRRIWGAPHVTRLALLARLAFIEASRMGAAMLGKVGLRRRRNTETTAPAETAFAARTVPATREAAGRRPEGALESARARRHAFHPDLPASKKLLRILEICARPLAVLALIAGGFFLGRMSAPPNAGNRAGELPARAPAIVSSGPPPEVEHDKTIAPPPLEGANSANEPRPTPPGASTPFTSEAQAEKTTPVPAAKPSKAHQRKLARAARPNPPAAPAPEAPPAAADDGNKDGWVIRRR